MTLMFMCALMAAAQIASPPPGALAASGSVEKRTRPSADEPAAVEYSLKRATAQMDTAALSWTRKHNCGSCHTNYPYLMARPLLRQFASPVENEVRTFLENRVAHWDDPKKDDGLMEAAQKAATMRTLRALQRADGGWCLPSLGHWKRRDGQPNDPTSPSDGYATGLIVYVSREAGVAVNDPAIQRGIAWLKSHQRASGRWFTRSLNDDEDHYITDAGTCLAVMALWRSARARESRLTQTLENTPSR